MLLAVRITWTTRLRRSLLSLSNESERRSGRERGKDLEGKTLSTMVTPSAHLHVMCLNPAFFINKIHHRHSFNGSKLLVLCVDCTGLLSWFSLVAPTGGRLNGHSRPERRPELAGYDSSSTLMSSELDTTSFFDSEDDDSASRWANWILSISPDFSSGRQMRTQAHTHTVIHTHTIYSCPNEQKGVHLHQNMS